MFVCTDRLITTHLTSLPYTNWFSFIKKIRFRDFKTLVSHIRIFADKQTDNQVITEETEVQRRMRREIRIFADKQTDNQVKSNSITEATLSTVVCGSSGSGPIFRSLDIPILKGYYLFLFL